MRIPSGAKDSSNVGDGYGLRSLSAKNWVRFIGRLFSPAYEFEMQ